MTRHTLLAGTAALLIAAGVSAQTPEVVEAQDSQEMLAGWLIGANVENARGESIGSINDLVIDEDGQVTAAVLAVGGFLGFGAKSVAVAIDELDVRYDGQEVVLDASREELEAAPDFAFRDREAPPPPPEPAADPALPQ